VLTPTFLPVVGGTELVLYEVFKRLSTRHEVLVVTPHLSRFLIDHYARGSDKYPVNFGVERYIDRWTMMKIRGHKVLRGLIPPFSFSAIVALRKHARSFKPDVINVHFSMPTGLAGAVANTFWGIPGVLTLNGRDVPGPAIPWFWKYWHRILYQGYSEITYVSEYCRDVVFGPRGPGTVTWNGVDFGRITRGNPHAVIERFRLQGRKVLFALQRLSREKGVDLILRAFAGVVRKEPEAVLLVAGTGSEEVYLKRLSEELGLKDRVIFCGFVDEDELKDFFAAADLFVFNSLYETFGIVLAQAMANGVPIVSVCCTAVPGVVDKAGILVPPGDQDGFQDAILELLNDPRKRKILGARGRKRAESLFDWDTIAVTYESVFRKAMRGKR
jgi:glycosyltransferase involved in cell wall biosynthesis